MQARIADPHQGLSCWKDGDNGAGALQAPIASSAESMQLRINMPPTLQDSCPERNRSQLPDKSKDIAHVRGQFMFLAHRLHSGACLSRRPAAQVGIAPPPPHGGWREIEREQRGVARGREAR